MRLWHQDLIKYLPNKQLLGEHREVCALRGLGFGRKHSVVDYVFIHPYAYLYYYHLLVMKEMHKRHFKIDPKWYNIHYRGKKVGYDYSHFTKKYKVSKMIYKEHTNDYLIECLNNLYRKKVKMLIENKKIEQIIKKNKNLYSYFIRRKNEKE